MSPVPDPFSKPDNPGGEPARRLLYGRRRGHKLRPGAQRLMSELLPKLAVDPSVAQTLDPAALFPQAPREIWLEIGFGGGEHLAWQAARNPDIGMIGAEPYLNGIAKLLGRIEREQLGNIRIFPDDMRDLLDALAESSVARVFLLFPDPWPKKRHHKRRFVNQDNLARLARVMRPGAELRIASDIPDYVYWTLAQMHRFAGFSWRARRAEDWRERPNDWPATRYEQKAKAQGRKASYLSFERTA